jgi:hypothetical protein
MSDVDLPLRRAGAEVIAAWKAVYPECAMEFGGTTNFRRMACAMDALRTAAKVDVGASG